MPRPSLWERLRGTRMAQVVLVYLGASWFVLQIAETLVGLLALPEWVGPVAVVLLLVGLVVVAATAWVQSLPQTTAAEEAGEVPTDWEVDAADVVDSLKKGKLPHLTWGRAILGGVVALSLLFGGAGLYVIVNGPVGFVGPQEAGAESAASGIAVLPFHVTGPDLEIYREGMVDLVSANLDGLSEFRAIDARTVLARWNREIGETADAELDAALRVAASTGARYAVLGSGVEAGGQVRFTADIYDLSDGSKVGDGGQVEGSPEEVLALVDALTVEVMRSLLDATDQTSGAQTFRLASILTESVPALRHYLEGDAAFRRGQFSEARESLERALSEDSTFALAYWRLGESIGWEEGIGALEGREAKRKAREYGERLPDREATLLDIGSAIADGNAHRQIDELRTYLRRYPDDPDGWYLMGEAGLHSYGPTGITDQEIEDALNRALELDPTFNPYYEHLLHWSTAKGYEDQFLALITVVDDSGWDPDRVERARLRWDLFQGDEATRAAAVARLEEMEQQDVIRIDQAARGLLDANLDRLIPIYERESDDPTSALQGLLREQGRFAEVAEQLAADSSLSGRANSAGMVVVAHESGDASMDDLAAALASIRDGEPGPDLNVHFTRAQLYLRLGDQASAERSRDAGLQGIQMQLAALPPDAGFDTTGVIGAFTAVFDAEFLRQAGDPAAGYALLDEAMQRTARDLGLSSASGLLALEAEQWRDAIRIFEGASRDDDARSVAKYHLGQAYEAIGDDEKALDAYRTFLTRWEKADPGLTWLLEAQAAVERLGG